MSPTSPIRLAIIAAVIALSGCAGTTVQTAIADGQLVCQVGAAYQAMQTAAGKPILAKGATATAVQTVCGLIGGAAVALPTGTTPASVTVALPPSVTIPLGT
jgi:hypothetical protein